jgi:hypothetical protein
MPSSDDVLFVFYDFETSQDSKSSYTPYMTLYYDISLKRLMYLRGSYYTQLEPLRSAEPAVRMPALV